MKRPHLPCLLNAKMKPICDLHPLRLTVDQSLSPPSTAEMLLPPEENTVQVRDFIRIWDGFGESAIYRVVSIADDHGLRRTLQLEHAIMTLSDEWVPSLAYSENTTTLLKRLLSYQTRIYWYIGEVEVDWALTLTAISPCQSIFAALSSLLDVLPQDYYLEFDQSRFPWQVNLKRMSTQVSAEGRLHRNLSSVRITQDASRLCTRVFPYGCGQGLDRVSLRDLLGRDYLDCAAVRTWGVAARSFTSDQITDAQTLKSVAERYLERHCQPTVTIQLQGIDLSQTTAEPLDAFRLGQCFRLALPESDLYYQERIVAMHIPDVFGQPGLVTLTLANRQPSLSDELADLLREVGSSKLTGSRMNELVFRSRSGSEDGSDITHYFSLDTYPALLACTVSLLTAQMETISGVSVDGAAIPAEEWTTGRFQALDSLRMEDGSVATGQHEVVFHLNAPLDYISSTITVKVVEQTA